MKHYVLKVTCRPRGKYAFQYFWW